MVFFPGTVNIVPLLNCPYYTGFLNPVLKIAIQNLADYSVNERIYILVYKEFSLTDSDNLQLSSLHHLIETNSKGQIQEWHIP